jgi:hypothetical protein
MLGKTVLDNTQPTTKKEARSAGYLPDVLSSDGASIFMRGTRFDLNLAKADRDAAHLWSSVGLLEDSWWHRTYWQIGSSMHSGWGGWAKAGQQVPAGRLLVTNGQKVFGYGRNQYDTPGAHVGIDADTVWGPVGRQGQRWTYYRLFARTVDPQANRLVRRGATPSEAPKNDWARQLPVLAQAMVLTDKTLFVAGPSIASDRVPQEPSEADPLVEAIESRVGGQLLAVSVENGATLSEHVLPSPPVFDGMAAAGGRLFLATKQGAVVCLAPGR